MVSSYSETELLSSVQRCWLVPLCSGSLGHNALFNDAKGEITNKADELELANDPCKVVEAEIYVKFLPLFRIEYASCGAMLFKRSTVVNSHPASPQSRHQSQ
jgi:hypothetical protein